MSLHTFPLHLGFEACLCVFILANYRSKAHAHTCTHTHTAWLTEAQIEGASPKSQAGNGSLHGRSPVVTVTRAF